MQSYFFDFRFLVIFSCLAFCMHTLALQPHDYSLDRIWERRPMPELDEQRREVHSLIADSLLSPSLHAIAVVRSRKHTDRYLRGKGIWSVARHRFDFQYDSLFTVQTLYSSAIFPDIVAIVQPGKRIVFRQMPGERPANFQKAMFLYEDEFALVFLRDDHVFNHSPDYGQSSVRRHRDFLERIIGVPQMYEQGLQHFGLETFLQPYSMHSLVEKYSSFRIEGPLWHEVDKKYWPEEEAEHDATDHYILPSEFLKDLILIIAFLASNDMESDLSAADFITEDGKAIAGKLVDRISSLPPEPIRDGSRIRLETHDSAFEQILFELKGRVICEDGKPISDALVMVMPNEYIEGGHDVTDQDGKFEVSANQSEFAQLRIGLFPTNYAPAVFAFTERYIEEGAEIVLSRGQPVKFILRFEEPNAVDTESLVLMVFDAKTEIPLFALHDSKARKTPLQGYDPWTRCLHDPLLINAAEYLLVLVDDSSSAFARIGVRSIDGSDKAVENVLITSEIIKTLRSFPIEGEKGIGGFLVP